MPIGIMLMSWDERRGIQILSKYPEDIKITDQTITQIYSTHEYSGESGMISLMVGSLNIASYYAGPERGIYLVLFLNLDEDPDLYEGGLTDIVRIILQNFEDDSYLELIPALFRRLSVYPSLNEEQLLALTYHDEIKRMIINRLREEGVVSKSELAIWLRDKYHQKIIDLENILMDLIKRGIVKKSTVKGIPSELMFLINDFTVLRVPPKNLLVDPIDKGLPIQLKKDYQKKVREFFITYQISEEDNLKIIDAIKHPQIYESLRLLRNAIVMKQDIEKLRKKGVEDINKVLKILQENQIIQVFEDDQENEYFTLITDFKIERFFPKYLLNVIKTEYELKSKADLVLMEYLNILEDTYFNLRENTKVKK